METVIINAKMKKGKKTEFLQTMESLKDLVQNHCCEFEMKLNSKHVLIRITFENEDDLKNKFSSSEFHILKGALLSLCEEVEIIQNKDKII